MAAGSFRGIWKEHRNGPAIQQTRSDVDTWVGWLMFGADGRRTAAVIGLAGVVVVRAIARGYCGWLRKPCERSCFRERFGDDSLAFSNTSAATIGIESAAASRHDRNIAVTGIPIGSVRPAAKITAARAKRGIHFMCGVLMDVADLCIHS